MLKLEQIRAINQARRTLRRLESESFGGEFPRGKFSEACKTAEGALLNVLIIARSWMGSPVHESDINLEEEEVLSGKSKG